MTPMNHLSGTLTLTRRLSTHDLWLAEPFNRAQAWIDILLLANTERHELRIRGVPVVVERGQLAWSIVSLADRWQWGREKAAGFLRELAAKGMVRVKSDTVSTLITVTNYNTYQTPHPATNQAADPSADTTPDRATDPTQSKEKGGEIGRGERARAESGTPPNPTAPIASASNPPTLDDVIEFLDTTETRGALLDVGAPFIPEPWAVDWYASMVENNRSFNRWTTTLLLRFRSDFQRRHPKALGDLAAPPNGAGSTAVHLIASQKAREAINRELREVSDQLDALAGTTPDAEHHALRARERELQTSLFSIPV